MEVPRPLTLGAEEVGSQKACINVGHIAEERRRHRLACFLFRRSTKELMTANGGMAAQKSPVWSGDGLKGERSEDTLSLEVFRAQCPITSPLKSLGRTGQVN